MIKILLTAFEPFGGDTENASALVCERIPAQTEQYTAVKRILPVAFAAGPAALKAAMKETEPDLIICLGQAGGRNKVTPEKVAINLMDGRIPDNCGYAPDEEPILPGGQTAFFTNVPVKQAVAAAREAGLPAAVSYTAGAYVCNTIFYTMMSELAEQGKDTGSGRVGGDFIHIPYIREQKNLPENQPALSLEEAVRTTTFLIAYLAADAARRQRECGPEQTGL